MQWLAALCVKHPVLTWVLVMAVAVVGIVGYGSLGLDQFPKVDIPTVLVTTTLNGAAPEEIESELTDKVEGAVNTISGIDELRSTSSQGVSLVVITFTLDKNIDIATQEVRDHINTVLTDLPKGIDPPVVTKVDPDASPILLMTLRAPGSLRDVTELADKKVRRQIESINGVGQVTILGGRKRQINLWLDPLRLQASGLTAVDVERALATQNIAVPGGAIETGPERLALRVEGRVPSVEAIGRIVVRETRDHATRVEDVARVEDGTEDENSWASEDGKQTVVLSLRKQSGENTVAVADAVRERMALVEKAIPGAELRVVRDNSQSIRTSVNAVREHLVLGAVFAALVVLFFLGNARSTIIAALAIPISIVGTFALMYVAGFTLNIITLLALALAVGIVIDDAIVVLENIVRFIEQKGNKPFVAAVLATRDIGLAVVATTLSLMAVFLPVAFMSGIVGRFLQSFGVTMAFAIAVSLFVSFSLTPMLAARWLPGPIAHGEERKKSFLERFVEGFYRPIERFYTRILKWVMSHRWVVVLACAATFGSCAPLAGAIPKGFQPENDLAEFEVNVRAPEGTSLTQTRLIAEGIAQQIRGYHEVEHTLLTIGNDAQQTQNRANIYVRLIDPKDRKLSQAELMDVVRRDVVQKAPKDLRIDVSISQQISSGQSSAQVQYTIAGPDLNRLAEFSEKILEKFRKVKGAVDVDSTLIIGNPEVRVLVNREIAANLGVNVVDVANSLQLLIGGLKVSTFEDLGEDYDIRARAEKSFRDDLAGLAQMTVPSANGGAVPLASVVTVKRTTGPSQINRLARQRQVTITSNVAAGVGQSTVSDALKKIIDQQHLPAGYSASPAGLTKETGRIVHGFLVAIVMSAVFMYLVLAAQFESWLHPVTIMLSLPLTIPFALLSLLIFHQELSIMTALGIIVLFGVVKKNAILQIDHTNHLRREGMPRDRAILEANRDRLRPILMTTCAFVAGMIPLLLSRGIGAGLNRSIAGVVVGGQTLSLALTLLATPVAYSLFDDAVEWRKRHKKRAPVDRGEADLEKLDAPHGAE
ncbi:MAG TPA: efflux RND transporter permease subunit [Polyangiaceae bacterium]|jgi:hydrophobe/amphiphile efflux-1 (HAE1) family protein|nr:efflux RND transporter permease subunit [Polyangiaceae bacterium]